MNLNRQCAWRVGGSVIRISIAYFYGVGAAVRPLILAYSSDPEWFARQEARRALNKFIVDQALIVMREMAGPTSETPHA